MGFTGLGLDWVSLVWGWTGFHWSGASLGGCAGKCCGGSDITCVTTDWRMDRVYRACYCDEGCLRTKDCCYDYPTECPAQSCVVTAWSHWSGPGLKQRHIVQEPKNSGEPCPNLEEQAGCMDYQSHQEQVCPGFITTMNLFGKRRRQHDITPLDPGFCMEYKMKSLTPHCRAETRPHARWMQYLREGYVVCVACRPPAMRNRSGSCQGDGQESDRYGVTGGIIFLKTFVLVQKVK
uniref:Somatomedin B and thrombospondin type 1 domain containing n=1 Tax=Oncorhynchus tshawytscha TaxID=74940 RepID=A0AAZ3P2Q8_ONCTS